MTKRIQKPKISQSDSFLRRFAKDEDGGVIVMTLLLLITMLIMGGMAVDFMRFESRRAELQSVADRAVLAAAELDQELEAEAVVVDMFEKTGYGDNIVSTSISDMSSSRSVSVTSSLDINTFYLRLAGIDTLSVPARSAAIEGAGNIEISLVLDISGSMSSSATDEDGNSTNRISLLQEAAGNFIDELLTEEYEDQISMSLVAYSQQVNIGDSIFDQLTLTEGTTIFENPDDALLPEDERTDNFYTNMSRCVDFEDDEFTTTAFDTVRPYQQVEAFDHYSNRWTSTLNRPLCPATVDGGMQTQIIPLSQDGTALKNAINSYEPTTFTAIHLGMKWGVSLLDPSMRDLFETAAGIDPEFAGERPSNYSANDEGISTVKYVVLMTDGVNVAGKRLRRGTATGHDADEDFYSTVTQRLIWSTYPHNYWESNYDDITDDYDNPFEIDNSWEREENDISYTSYTSGTANTQLDSICTAAKAQDITVFAIAMGSGSSQMESCASSSAHYFETQGDELAAIFAAIAEQITELRLSL